MPDTTDYRVWQLPAHVDTDALAPGPYMQLGIEGIAPHCLEQLMPTFAQSVQPGDIIAAGSNFGVGSSREQAAQVLRHLGVQAVLAPSFAGLFYRNAINLGLMVLVCPQADQIRSDQRVHLNLETSVAHVFDSQKQPVDQIPFEPLPDFLHDIIKSGGLLAQLKTRLASQSDEYKP